MARSRPIEISFAANVRDFLRKMRGVEDSVDDVAESLDDAAKDADGFERDFTDAMKDAERAAERSGRDIGNSFDGVDDQFGQVGQEAGQEFRQNLGESLSSGNLEDIFQDTLGGLVASMKGPLGLAVGAVAAVAALAFNQARQEAEKLGEFVEGIAGAVDEQFDVLEGRMTELQRTEQFAEWLEENKNTLQELADVAGVAGVNMNDFAVAAFEGGAEAATIREQLQEAVRAGTTIVGEANPTPVLDDSAQAASEMMRYLDGAVDESDQMIGKQQTINGIMDTYLAKRQQESRLMRESRTHAQAILDSVTNMPERRRTYLEFVAVGSGAAYLDRANGNYSPGHVAINNMHTGG